MAKTKRKSTRTSTRSVVAAAPARRSNMMSSNAMAAAPASTSVMQLGLMYALFFIANAVLIYLANMFFPTNVVLGTHLYSPMAGLLYSNVVITSILVGLTPIIETISSLTNLKLGNMGWMALYLVVNIVTVWFVGRMAEQLGLGISSWLVAVVLGFVMNLVQGLVVVNFVYKK